MYKYGELFSLRGVQGELVEHRYKLFAIIPVLYGIILYIYISYIIPYNLYQDNEDAPTRACNSAASTA